MASFIISNPHPQTFCTFNKYFSNNLFFEFYNGHYVETNVNHHKQTTVFCNFQYISYFICKIIFLITFLVTLELLIINIYHFYIIPYQIKFVN